MKKIIIQNIKKIGLAILGILFITGISLAATKDSTYELISKLSDDIGIMADRIGNMADRIGEMSDRIVEVEKHQDKEILETQKNILKLLEIIEKNNQLNNSNLYLLNTDSNNFSILFYKR